MRPARAAARFAVLLVVALAGAARAQGDALCTAVAALDRAVADGFVALREPPVGRSIPPSGSPSWLFTGRALFEGGIDARVTVADRRPADYRFGSGATLTLRYSPAVISLTFAAPVPTPIAR